MVALITNAARRLLGMGKPTNPMAPESAEPLAAQARYVVIDLEMTGLDPARDVILSYGAVRMQGGRLQIGETFAAMVRPESGERAPVRQAAILAHSITPDEAAMAGDPRQALEDFLDYCGRSVLVGYCVGLDAAFLKAAAGRIGGETASRAKGLTFIDVAALYRRLRGMRASSLLETLPARDVNLFQLAEALGVETRSAHDALADAVTTAQVFQRFLALLQAHAQETGEPLTLARLTRMGDPEARSPGFGQPHPGM